MNATYDILILGAGPAGLTAALYAHRAGLNVFILGGNTPGGQVTTHYRVENYPGFPGGVTGAELMMKWLQQVVDETGVMPLLQNVTSTDLQGKIKKVALDSGEYEAFSVIVATGARPRELGVTGESELLGKGVYHCATCDAPLLRTMDRRRAVVIGGGDTAFHTALALLPHAEEVTVISRGDRIRAKVGLVKRFQESPKGRIILSSAVKEICGKNHITHLVLENVKSGQVDEFGVEALFVGIGQKPNVEFLNRAVQLDDAGFIQVDDVLRTSVPGVFAAGDVRSTPMRQILTAAADGALAAQSCGEYLRTART